MRLPFKGTFPITQIFGVNPNAYKRFGLLGHNGLDYALPLGTHVLAPHSGTVLEARHDQSGYGWYVKIENNKEGSVLAHFKTLKVKVGDKVYEGQLVGYSGNSGNSTGPHLHWGYYKHPRNRQNGYGGFIDQSSYIKETTPPPQDDLEQQLKDVIELSEKLASQRDRLNKEIEKKDKLISKQSEELLNIEEEKNVAVNRAEKYFKEAENKEDLREKWFNANKKCQEALETCKIDRAAFQKRVTILEAGWEKPESIKTWLRAFINWIMKK